jgi:hypothetical protein
MNIRSVGEGLEILIRLQTENAPLEIKFSSEACVVSCEATLAKVSSDSVKFAIPTGSLDVALPTSAICKSLDTSLVDDKYTFHLEIGAEDTSLLISVRASHPR